MKSKINGLNLSGNLWINRDNLTFLGEDRIKFLEKIDELGSITKAAKAVGICYKNVWDTISSINNLAEKPLVNNLVGSSKSGGTCVTEEGKQFIAQFNIIQEELQNYLNNLEEKRGDSKNRFNFLHRNSMEMSAHTIFYGTITDIIRSAVNAKVTLTLKGGVKITSVVTNDAIDDLDLAVGKNSYAIIKASSVIVGSGVHNCRISTRNIFCGTVARNINGPVNTKVDVEIDGETMSSVIITHDNIVGLDPQEGDHACVLFKASNVILGINCNRGTVTRSFTVQTNLDIELYFTRRSKRLPRSGNSYDSMISPSPRNQHKITNNSAIFGRNEPRKLRKGEHDDYYQTV